MPAGELFWLLVQVIASLSRDRTQNLSGSAVLWSKAMLTMSKSHGVLKDYRSQLVLLLALTGLMVAIFF